jgi:hypothetical protein
MAVTGVHDTKLFVNRQPGGMFAVQDVSQYAGKVFYVGSNITGATDAAGYGQNPGAPFATIDYALGTGNATANRGDVIFVLPAHVESLGNAQIDVDVAGVSIIGLGNGPDRPRIDYDHANSSVDIGASGVLLENLTFRPSVTVVAIGVDIEAAVTNTTIRNCEFMIGEAGDGTDEFVLGIDIKAGCTRTMIDNILYTSHASCNGTQAGVILTGASDLVTIKNSVFWGPQGAGANACIEGITTLSTRVLIDNCLCQTDAEPGIELLTGTTGIIRDCTIFSDLATIDAAIVADGCACIDNKYCEVGDEAGTLIKTESVDD